MTDQRTWFWRKAGAVSLAVLGAAVVLAAAEAYLWATAEWGAFNVLAVVIVIASMVQIKSFIAYSKSKTDAEIEGRDD